MRRISLITLLSLLINSTLSAKEGMWLPFLLQSLNEADMKAMGMKITAKDLYDESKSSLKDAVVLFGGGCTGEVISNQGLLLTNHHCGYGSVSRLSSIEKDYLKNGFWAKNIGEEIPCPGLSVTFIEKIVDVTNQVTAGLSDDLRDTARSGAISRRIDALIKENTKDKRGATIKSFFADNAYYMFITKKFNDVRLVGFPPNSIGKFGGDTDNWAWPRHTGDFSVFRIYADSNNDPANYSPKNKAYVPKKFFKINTSGVRPGDFTLVYGFPGRTQQNLTSSAVNELMNITDPARIKIRSSILDIMNEDMAKDRSVFIKYASKQAGLANYYKKWQGELMGLKVNDAVNKKLDYEKKFKDWSSKNNPKYAAILDSTNALYAKQSREVLLNEYFNEAWTNCEGLEGSLDLEAIINTLDKTKSIDSIKRYKTDWIGFYNNYHLPTDKKITRKMFELMQSAFGNVITTSPDQAVDILSRSLVGNPDELYKLFEATDALTIIKKIQDDPGYILAKEMNTKRTENFNGFVKIQKELLANYHDLVQGKRLMMGNQPIYPDANSTLRVSYGKVEGLRPADGLLYDYYTTLDGVMAKENNEIEEFEVPEKLKTLWRNKDYGTYALADGRMPLAFIASNHTTGGNSGSPVLNANGELIGTNFDRIYEGTMSDVMYDINLCRNITLDIRYTLFIIEKFGDAGWLLKEMEIINNNKSKATTKPVAKKPVKK